MQSKLIGFCTNTVPLLKLLFSIDSIDSHDRFTERGDPPTKMHCAKQPIQYFVAVLPVMLSFP